MIPLVLDALVNLGRSNLRNDYSRSKVTSICWLYGEWIGEFHVRLYASVMNSKSSKSIQSLGSRQSERPSFRPGPGLDQLLGHALAWRWRHEGTSTVSGSMFHCWKLKIVSNVLESIDVPVSKHWRYLSLRGDLEIKTLPLLGDPQANKNRAGASLILLWQISLCSVWRSDALGPPKNLEIHRSNYIDLQ